MLYQRMAEGIVQKAGPIVNEESNRNMNWSVPICGKHLGQGWHLYRPRHAP